MIFQEFFNLFHVAHVEFETSEILLTGGGFRGLKGLKTLSHA
jgi:hypothetical protein